MRSPTDCHQKVTRDSKCVSGMVCGVYLVGDGRGVGCECWG